LIDLILAINVTHHSTSFTRHCSVTKYMAFSDKDEINQSK